jgi:hypothetical protein
MSLTNGPADALPVAGAYNFGVITKRYPIEPHGRKLLSVRRTQTWSEIVVRIGGRELGRSDREALLNGGVEYTLRDHTVLRVWLELDPRGNPMLFLTRNGMPLPGSEGDPVRILFTALILIWMFATLQIIFAASVICFGRPEEIIYVNLAAGLILAVLGILAWRRSLVAMVIASLLCFSELGLLLVSQGGIDATNIWLLTTNIWRLVLVLGISGWLLWRGIVAVDDLKAITLPIRHPPQPLHHDSTDPGSS